MINSIVFSYNRAPQLRLFLESVAKNATGIFKINILYKAGDKNFESGYEKLKAENILPDINWVKETSFKEDLLGLFDSTEHICFFRDDIIYDSFTYESVIEPFKNEDIFCFSLKLGENTMQCYDTKAKNILYGQEYSGDYMVWDWTKHYWDFGCPLSVNGHIFRTKDIFKMFKKMVFDTPSSLEESFYEDSNKFSETFPRHLMTSFKSSHSVNIPPVLIAEDLNKKMLSDEFIDFESIDFSEIVGCQQELDFKFKKS